MEAWSKDELWQELKSLGEDRVRERLATGQYSRNPPQEALVKEWIRIKDQERFDAFNREQARIAKSAKNAAWIAATAAIIAATGAIISIIVNLP